jgi:hypothetical protein
LSAILYIVGFAEHYIPLPVAPVFGDAVFVLFRDPHLSLFPTFKQLAKRGQQARRIP